MSVARAKYFSQATTLDGIWFHSRAEADRYAELSLLVRSGLIRNLRRQVKFELHAPPRSNGELPIVGCWLADFVYDELCADSPTPWHVVEDVKGFKTALYRWKKRHVEAEHGVTIQETGPRRAASRSRRR